MPGNVNFLRKCMLTGESYLNFFHSYQVHIKRSCTSTTNVNPSSFNYRTIRRYLAMHLHYTCNQIQQKKQWHYILNPLYLFSSTLMPFIVGLCSHMYVDSLVWLLSEWRMCVYLWMVWMTNNIKIPSSGGKEWFLLGQI